jgi:cephalosporin hydroxylase
LTLIKELAASLPINANVIEIGSAFGRSTFSWLDGLTSNATLTIIDTFSMSPRDILQMKADKNEVKNKFQSVVYDMFASDGQEKTWKFVTSMHKNNAIIKNVYNFTSDFYILNNYSRVFDCVYLDADHRYEAVKNELEFFKNSSIICGDDYFSLSWPDVKKAVDEYCTTYNKKIELYKDENFYIIKNR